MPQLVKPYTYSSGTTISSTQVNANEDAIINTINALDEENFDASTQIPNSMLVEIQPDIVDAHADNATEYLTSTTPGYTGGIRSGGTALPALMTDEIERLRYRHLANNHLISTSFMDSSATQRDIAWVEPQISGPQLFSNNGFEVKTSATANVTPDGWTAIGPATSYVITAPGLAVPSAGLNKKALRVTFGASANRGFSQVLTGLKASTKYLIGMTYAKVSGTPTLKITTTNGLASGDYQNLAATVVPSGTTIANFQGVVQTTTAGADITVSFTNTSAAGDVVDFYQVWAYEMADSTNLGLPHIPMQTATYSTADDIVTNAAGGAWAARTGLSLTQYIPALGYRLIYEVFISYKTETVGGALGEFEYAFRIQANGSTVEGPYSYRQAMSSSNEFGGGTVHMKYVLENPTPGTSYAMTTDVWTKGNGANDADTIIFNPTLGTAGDTLATVSKARLIVERL